MGIKSPIFIKILNDTHDIVTLMTQMVLNIKKKQHKICISQLYFVSLHQ